MEQQLTTPAPLPPAVIWEGSPDLQLEYAHKAAKALMARVAQKKRPIIINGRQYLEIGDWQTVGHFFGCSVGTDWSRPIERHGAIAGYEAKAIVYRHGVVVASAEAICMVAEKRWSTAAEYALKSMAQTRAASKALRNAVGWVVELAGYSSTPAEEMDSDGQDENPAPKAEPKPVPKQIEAPANPEPSFDPDYARRAAAAVGEPFDPETGELSPKPAVEIVTPDEAAELQRLLVASDTPLAMFLNQANRLGGNLTAVEQLPRVKYNSAAYWLDQRIPKPRRAQ